MATGVETPKGRKRSRPQVDDGESHRETSGKEKGKKPRLDNTSEPSSSTPKARKSAASAISGPLNYGRGTTSTRRSSQNKKRGESIDQLGEVPDSEDERKASGSQSKRGQHKRGGVPSSADKNASSVYEFPDSGDELSTEAVGRAQASRISQQDDHDVAPTKKDSVQRRRGRPRKSSTHELTEASQEGAILKDTPTKKRSRRRSTEVGTDEAVLNNDSETSGQEVAAQPDSPKSPIRRRNGDQRAKEPRLLKGILTPRKGTPSDRRRKSVVFESGKENDQAEVYFEDLPSKPVKTPAQSVRKPTVTRKAGNKKANADTEVEEEEEEEELCAVCNKPDSAPPNEIILCDGCDLAVHQVCYNVPTIPEGDWLCLNCLEANAVDSQDPSSKGFASIIRIEDQAPDIPNFEQHLQSIQRVLIDRCTGRRRIKLRGEDDAYDKAFQLIEQTIVAGEGNSMLVIGARGAGKTTLVESAVSAMSREHKDEFHVVRLNGFIHTDDKLALKEIWRQLGKEMEVEDDLIKRTNNYADTLASLLALLSHPSEIAATQDGVTSKSVVFIIDEFDLFATHARQTLLYNLFDIAQAKKAPIAVLGLTTRIDVVESLEKRVKSRFSHRYIYLSLPKSLPAYWDICRQGLIVGDKDLEEEGIDIALDGLSRFLAWWAERIEALHKEPAFQDHLERHFCVTKSVSAFLATCILPLSSLSSKSPSPTIHFGTSRRPHIVPADEPDSKLHLLESLSDLDLSMLVAAARLDIVAHTDTVNFAMAYDEYASLMARQRVASASSGLLTLGGGARVWGRGVAGVAWERLVTLGLLVPASMMGRGGGAGLESKMWKVDVALEEIPASVKLNAVLARWCREI